MTQTNNDFKVGILGDGQLALMLAESLSKLGTPFFCLSQSSQSPMHRFFPDRVTSDKERFRRECSIFTLENEFHSVLELTELLKEKADRLFPDLQSYAHFADKISQRTFYSSLDIHGPRWLPLRNDNDLLLLRSWAYPYVIKTSQGGYDGKGVRIINSSNDLTKALSDFKFFDGFPLLAEEKVLIVKEVAQGFLRSSDGRMTLLPLVETIQENGVCNLVQHPPAVSPNVQSQIEFYLRKMAESGLVGIFNFEFFIDHQNKVLINEGAPRTHNSQHLTMDASAMSQFDLLAAYLTDPSKAPGKVSALPSIMINILGKRSGRCGELKLPNLGPLRFASKLYGKETCSPGRKMGHVNVIDENGSADLISVGRKILQEYDL